MGTPADMMARARAGREGECQGCRREDAAKIKQCPRCSGTGNEPNWIIVPVWACPECLSYYASSSARELNEQETHSITSEPTGTRDACAYCKAQGKDSARVRVDVVVPVPVREVP
jgi:hypothetical protein